MAGKPFGIDTLNWGDMYPGTMENPFLGAGGVSTVQVPQVIMPSDPNQTDIGRQDHRGMVPSTPMGVDPSAFAGDVPPQALPEQGGSGSIMDKLMEKFGTGPTGPVTKQATSGSSTSSQVMRPKALDGIQADTNAELEGVQARAEGGAAREQDYGARVSEKLGADAQVMAADAHAMQKRQDKDRGDLEGLQRDYQKDVDAYHKAVEGYDPSRLMKGSSGVFATIAMALGGSMGRHNDSIDIVNNAINRDIDKQKEGIKAAKDSMGINDNLFQRLRAKSGDDRSATEQTRAAMKDATATWLESQAMKHKGSAMAQTYLDNASQLKMQANEHRAAAEMALAKHVQTTSNWQLTQTATNGIDQLGKAADVALKLQKLEGKEGGVSEPERRAYYQVREKAAKIGALAPVAESAYGNLLTKDKLDLNTLPAIGTPEGDKVANQISHIESSLLNALSGSAFSKEELSRIEKRIEGSAGQGNPRRAAILRETFQNYKSQLQGELKQFPAELNKESDTNLRSQGMHTTADFMYGAPDGKALKAPGEKGNAFGVNPGALP